MKTITRRHGWMGGVACLWVAWVLFPQGGTADDQTAPEVLYNGIRLSRPWPPRRPELSPVLETPPYLRTPPKVIPIDVGRQLFVDDFLIENTDLSRVFHHAQYVPGNPVLESDQTWESEGEPGGGPTAMPYSDGVWYDPADGLFKMWYMSGYIGATAYAQSTDGIHWEKPQLDVVPGTNIVLPQPRGSTTVWLDHEEPDAQRRFKLSTPAIGDSIPQLLFFSRDGIHWTDPEARAGASGDRTTFFYNPFRKVWVSSIKTWYQGRARAYYEASDFLDAADWQPDAPVLWIAADRLDPVHPALLVPAQLYNLDAVAYESIMLGMVTVWRGQTTDRPKPNELLLAFSRDGFHWDRPDRTPFLTSSDEPGAWNHGNVQSAGGCCLIVGDQIYFYVSGRAGVPGASSSGKCSTGLATLRRDGFASLRSECAPGTVTTRPITFQGQQLFVNADVARGELLAEILDEHGAVIPLFSRDRCVPMRTSSTCQRIDWSGASSLASLRGRIVRVRFHVTQGDLYAFWVSPDANGASHGYVAAGGPGFTGPRDTVGMAAGSTTRELDP